MIWKVLQWIAAIFATVIAYTVSLTACAFLDVKLLGLQPGVVLPVTARLSALAEFTALAPVAAAIFVGSMTVPFAHRGAAAIVFPMLMFAAVMLFPYAAGHHGLPRLENMLLLALVCAITGGLIYWLWQGRFTRFAGV